MLGTINPEILFLQQEDQIKAGLLDMKMILQITEETYKLLGEGKIQNPPKTHLGIPDPENWNSFFNTMPCHIAGSYNIAGVKWAAESKKNADIPGIPYGIDISILSDPETVLPFCILDGTIITAMRTSAVAGVQAKYCAPSDTKTATLIGAGVIGETMVMAICEAIPTVKTIYICDLDLPKAEKIAAEYKDKYPGVEIIPTADSKAAAAKSELIMGEGYMDMTRRNIEAGIPMGVYGTQPSSTMFCAITLNNVRVAFLCFVLGVFTSIFPGVSLMFNGIMIGAFQTFFYQQHLLGDCLYATMLHGTLELSAIVIAGGAGIQLGNGWLFPGTYSRPRSFLMAARRAVRVLVSTVPVFVVAAFIESFLTRYTLIGNGFRLLIIGSSAAFLVFYYILLPIKRHRDARPA